MRHHADPSSMTPDQRAAEVARLLARGVLRLLSFPAHPPPEKPLDSSQNSLELSSDPRLSVHNG